MRKSTLTTDTATKLSTLAWFRCIGAGTAALAFVFAAPVLCAVLPASAPDSAEVCDDLLVAHPVPAPELPDDFGAQFYGAARPQVGWGIWRPKDIFDAAGIQPKDGQTIVMASHGNLIGDALLGDFGQLFGLHARFPHSKIRVIGGGARVLRPQPWLEVIPSLLPSFVDESPALEAAINQGDFVLYSRDIWGPVFRAISAKGAMGIGYTADCYGKMMTGGMSVVAPQAVFDQPVMERLKNLIFDWERGVRNMNEESRAAWEKQQGRNFAKVQIARVSLGSTEYPATENEPTVFEQKNAEAKALFGSGLHFPLELFTDLNAAGPRRIEFLRSAFKGRESAPYAIINLNTAAEFKLDEVRSDYVARLKRLIAFALKDDGELNLLVTAPEPQFGPEISEGARALLASLGPRVAFMPEAPEARDLWLPLIHGAAWVATQDSGFNWMALIVKRREQILTFGRRTGGADHWRMPGQPFSVFSNANANATPEKRAKEDEPIFNWMTSRRAAEKAALPH